MKNKFYRTLKLIIFCVLLIALCVTWKKVKVKGFVIQYGSDGYYDSEMWNPYISEQVNTKPLIVRVDGQAVIGDFYMNRSMELMVPLNKITECFDCSENMYLENEIILQKKDIIMKFYKDSPDIYFINDVQTEKKNVIELVEGECFISSSVIVKNFGYEIGWDVASNTLDFNTVWEGNIFPSYYNLRDVNRDTVVKNQGSHGTCWAVAAVSALETTLRPEEEILFAAEHMALKNSFTRNPDDGGEFTMSMAYLLSWQGPVLESEDSYGDFMSPDGLNATKHVQEIQIIKNKNYDKIKEAVFKNGAVQTSIYTSLKNSASRSKFYSKKNFAYCYMGDEVPNHEVIIIGWDDNYPKENFNIQPQNNGAFICQNSWGQNFGDNGVFYVSYEDSQIGNQSVVYSKIGNIDNYNNLYQTDSCGWVGQIGYGKEVCYFANVFTAKGEESVKAVGFYAVDDNTDYQIYKVENYKDNSSFNKGELIAEGTVENAGFYTIDLYEGFKVKEGQRFSIIIKINTPNTVYPVAVEYAVADRCENVDLSDGEGYISPYGDSWMNVENDYKCNVCMKVYTDNDK